MAARPFMSEAERERIAEKLRGAANDFALRAVPADEFIAGFVPTAYALEPIVPRAQLVALTALPNAGKTTIAVQFALAAADLARIPGIEADPGRVLFLCGENDANLNAQLIAACEQHQVKPDRLRGRLWVVPQRFGLAAMVSEIAVLATEVGGFVLIVVDTRIAYSDSLDENDNQQAVEDARALRDLTRIDGTPAVLALCHPPKGAQRDNLVPRGGSSFFGEIDANLTLWSDGDVVELASNKRRMADFDTLKWQMRVVEIDRNDKRGRPVRSVVAVRVTDHQADTTADAHRAEEDLLLEVMATAPSATIAEWAVACGWMHKMNPAKSKVARVLYRLAADRLVRKYRGRWVLTGAGKRESEVPK